MQLRWGELYLASDGEVLQAAWEDQNVVLFMTTVSTGMEKILRIRRRPPKSATNAKTSKQIFGDELTKDLLIPRLLMTIITLWEVSTKQISSILITIPKGLISRIGSPSGTSYWIQLLLTVSRSISLAPKILHWLNTPINSSVRS